MTFKCRHCGNPLNHPVVDLGHQPPSNAYLQLHHLDLPEITYPLTLYVCDACWLVQLPSHANADQLFTAEYAYFSSTSTSWCEHASQYVNDVVTDMDLNEHSFVVELAANDGYLLQYLVELGIPCLGIEPTKCTADAARKKGIDIVQDFFTAALAEKLQKADLIIANNVLAHVPDINDFVFGISKLLKTDGRVSIEFPHLLALLQGTYFDTIYHEHYSYLSLSFVSRVAKKFDLEVVDVDHINTHGGSLRVWLAHNGCVQPSQSVHDQLQTEHAAGIESIEIFEDFSSSVQLIKNNLLKFLLKVRDSGKTIYGYGAAAKGNTLLNYAGIKSDLLPGIADKAPSKQGKFMPGSHIPIISVDALHKHKPDFLLVLPWNIINEVSGQLPDYKLVRAIPQIEIFNSPTLEI